MKCDCPDWEPQIAKIDGPIVLQSIRAGRDLYDGKPFVYCPWCGSGLVDEAIRIGVAPEQPWPRA